MGVLHGLHQTRSWGLYRVDQSLTTTERPVADLGELAVTGKLYYPPGHYDSAAGSGVTPSDKPPQHPRVLGRRRKAISVTDPWPAGGYGAGRRVPQAGHQRAGAPSIAWIDVRSSWWCVQAWRARWMRMVSMMNCARSRGVAP